MSLRSILFPRLPLVKRRVERVEILAVEVIGGYAQAFSKPLVMHDLTLSEEAYRVDDIGIIAKPQDIVVRCAGFLLQKGCGSTTCMTLLVLIFTNTCCNIFFIEIITEETYDI